MSNAFLLLLIALTGFHPKQEGARYLVITHDNFYEAITPLAEWKHKKGVETRVVKLSEIGSDSSQIRAYIQDAYDTWNPRPEYVLLVGDVEWLPTHYRNHYTDNVYAALSGGNYLSDVAIGRFSVDNARQCSTMVAKTLGYERTPWTVLDDWFTSATLLIRDDYDSGDTLWYYPDIWFARDLMEQHGFTDIDTLFKRNSADAGDIERSVSEGRGLVGYRGCGGSNWYYPFDAEPGNTYNGWQLPVIFSATCNTGSFQIDGYICERWTRAGTPAEPKGAVAFLGTNTTNHSSKRSVMWRGFWTALFTDSIFALGDALVKAKHDFYNEFGTSQQREYEGWNLVGDPELNVRTAVPRELTVTHAPAVYLGSDDFTVSVKSEMTPVEGAVVCLFKDDDVYEYGSTDALGEITLSVNPITPDTMWVTVTAYNHIPYEGYARALANGPYVGLLRYGIVDTANNGDAIPNPGERIWFPTWVINYGDDTARAVTSTLSTSDPYVALADSVEYFSSMAPLDSAVTAIPYEFSIAPNCPDEHDIQFALTCGDTLGNDWASRFTITVAAPIMDFDHCIVDDAGESCPDGFIDPGETVRLLVYLTNTGTGVAHDVKANLRTTDTYIAMTDSTALYGDIGASSTGDNTSNPYVLICDPTTPRHHEIPFFLDITSEACSITVEFTLKVSMGGNYLVWDPDTNHTSGPILDSLLRVTGYAGDYTTDLNEFLPYLPKYRAVFICLGVAYHNYVLYTPENSEQLDSLCRYLDNGGRVYMEGGDTWYRYSYPRVLHPYFRVLLEHEGYGDVDTLVGQKKSFTEGMSFVYSGENRSMDRIRPDSGAWAIFENSYPSYVNGVAYAEGCGKHKTILTTFELGGLVDGVTTKAVLVDSIMKWFLRDAAHDVALWTVDRPEHLFVDSDSSLTPRVTVKNVGAYAENFEVICTVDSASQSIFGDTIAVANLTPGGLDSVVFDSWVPSVPDNRYTLTFRTELVSDGQWQNNARVVNVVSFDLVSVINSNHTLVHPVMDGFIDITYEWLDASRTDISNIFGKHTYADAVSQAPRSAYLYVMNTDTCVYFGIDARVDHSLDDGHCFFFGFDDNHDTLYPEMPDTTEGVVALNYHPQGATVAFYSSAVAYEIELSHGVSTTSGNLQYEFAVPIGDLPYYLNTSLGDTVGLGLKVGHYVGSPLISYGRWPHEADEPVLNPPQMGDLVLCLAGTEEIPNKLPRVFAITQNRPNPFRGMSNIRYQIPNKAEVTLRVYDVTGRMVRTLVDRVEKPGYKSVVWKGKNDRGRMVGAGIYFYRFEANSVKGTKRFVKIKKMLFFGGR